MPLRTVKRDTAEALTVEWILHVKNFKLTHDKNNCAGCQICSLACPKEAIKVTRQPKAEGEKAIKAKVDIDLAKCNFCGICDVLCPYGAMKITLDGQHLLSVVEKESFPLLIRDIQVDPSKYAASSKKCEDACPLNLIKVSIFAADGKTLEDASSMKKKKKARLQVEIDVEKDRCPCCRICEFRCPEGVIRVRKFLHGMMVINTQECPDGCRDCLDICPLTGVLYFSEKDKKVHVDEMFCVYCGACKVVCPVEKALELKRTKISHTPVSSGAWNKALERIASPIEMIKELKAKGSLKAVEAAEKLLAPKRD